MILVSVLVYIFFEKTQKENQEKNQVKAKEKYNRK